MRAMPAFPALISVVPQLRMVIWRALSSSTTAQGTSRGASSVDRGRSGPALPRFARPNPVSRIRHDASRSTSYPPGRESPRHVAAQVYETTTRGPARVLPRSSKRLVDITQAPRRDFPPHRSKAPRDGGESGSLRTPGSNRDDRTALKPPPGVLRATDNRTPPQVSAVAAAKAQPFSSFTLHEALLDKLPDLLGYPESGRTAMRTMPIQSLALGHLLDNPGDALLAAETGSGKTLAYVLPLMHHLKRTDPLAQASSSQAASDSDRRTSPPPPLSQEERSRISKSRSDGLLLPRSIVISPTHELTRQSTSVLKALSHGIKLSVMGLSNTKESSAGGRTGGVDVLLGTSGSMRRALGLRREEREVGDQPLRNGRQYARIQARSGSAASQEALGGENPDDPVDSESGTKSEPGREPDVGLHKVEWVVIDEADVLLGPDFISETTQFLSLIPASAHLLLVTATLPPSLLSALSTHPVLSARPIAQLLAPGLHRLPQGIKTRFVGDTGGNLAASVVKEVQGAFVEDARERQSSVAAEGQGDGGTSTSATRAVVFCNTDNRAREVARKFREKQPTWGVLEWTSASATTSAGQEQGKGRVRGSQGDLAPFLRAPRTSRTSASPASASAIPPPRILITTSLLSRGLDFNHTVRTVVLVDPSRDTLDFVHRAGRTGRAGAGGRVIVFGMGDGVGGARGAQGWGRVGQGVVGVIRGRR